MADEEKKKLLLLEDEELMAKLILREIRHYRPEWDIKHVVNPYEARKLISGNGNYNPDFILTDNNMHSIENGAHFVSDFRTMGYSGRIILASGDLTPDLYRSLGPLDVLCVNKPFGRAIAGDFREMQVLPDAIVRYFETGERFTEVDAEPAGF